jgi:hypothetical protein
MLIETNWLNMLAERGENKVTSFKLTKYDLATAYLDTLVLVLGFFFMAQQPIGGQGLLIVEASRSHSDTPHSVGLLLTRDIHAPGGIRSRNPSKREAADPHLRPCGHWDRQC